jgi:Tfp pilus assembly protein PilO
MNIDLKKIIEYFNNLTDQVRYSVLGGVVFLIIVLDVVFLVLPQIGGIADVNDQIKKLSDDTQQVLADKGSIRLLKKNLDETRGQMNSLSRKVRPIQEVPAILSTISSVANEYGVKINQLVPEKNLQETLTSNADGQYYALPILIQARCGYHKFGHFLYKLENEDLFFIMKDFIVQNDEQSSNMHLFSMTIKIILVDKGAASPKSL